MTDKPESSRVPPGVSATTDDALARLDQLLARLDRAVTTLETAGRNLTGPLEKVTSALDPATLRRLPETLDAIRKETLPALRAAADTQTSVTALQATVERVVQLLGDLPGAGIVRRFTGGRDDAAPATPAPRPPPEPYGDAPPPDIHPTRSGRRGRRG